MSKHLLAAALYLGLAAGCGGGGSGGSNAGPAQVPPATTPVQTGTMSAAYPGSVVLGSLAAQPLELREAAPPAATVLVAGVQSALLLAGSNPLASLYRNPAAPGALIACVSAPTSSTGLVGGINLGVNIKSAAVLLDNGWSDAGADALTAMAAAGVQFDGWENCGEKPEGRPSPASTRTLLPGGGMRDDIYDGNPSTHLNIITINTSAAQLAAMLSTQGYVATASSGVAYTVWLRVYRSGSGGILLIEQGLPLSGPASQGFLSMYLMR
jgi:hypothetical protein